MARKAARPRRQRASDRHQQLRRDRDRPRVIQEGQGLELGRGHEARDDQLQDAEAREGRALLRAHLRSDQGLGVLLRQVQARPLQGHRLRALRRRGHPLQGPARAHGPHRPGRLGLPHLVLQGRPLADRLPDRHGSEGAREGPLLRRLRDHLGRHRGPRQGPRQAREGDREAGRRVRARARAAHAGAQRVPEPPPHLPGHRPEPRRRRAARRLGRRLQPGRRALGRRHRLPEADQGRGAGEDGQGAPQDVRDGDRRHRGLPRGGRRAPARGLQDLLAR